MRRPVESPIRPGHRCVRVSGADCRRIPFGNDDIHDDFEREVRLIPQQVLDPPDRPSPIRFMTMFSRFVDPLADGSAAWAQEGGAPTSNSPSLRARLPIQPTILSNNAHPPSMPRTAGRTTLRPGHRGKSISRARRSPRSASPIGHGVNASPSATPGPQIDYCSKNNLELIRMPRSCHWSPCLISESWISAGPDSNSAFAVYAAEITFPCWVVTDMLACPLAPS